MFTHKKVKEIKRGDPIPANSKWLESKRVVVRQWEEEVSPMHANETCYEYGWKDVYEIPCNEDGSTKLKVTYENNMVQDIPSKDLGLQHSDNLNRKCESPLLSQVSEETLSPAAQRANQDRCDDCHMTGGWHNHFCKYNPF